MAVGERLRMLRCACVARQISDALGLSTIKSRQWSIQETSATKGRGLFEGFDWYCFPLRVCLRETCPMCASVRVRSCRLVACMQSGK